MPVGESIPVAPASSAAASWDLAETSSESEGMVQTIGVWAE